ncbi:MAG: ferritin family protein [Candidatus Bathyarchaeota archaeon]|nr:MAG: ferritin family protein [Candidatus Bathyarchaeota archaeon]
MAHPNLKVILEAAIKTEEQSHALYIMAQNKVKYPSSKKFLQELAQEELKHKKKLLAIMEDQEKLSELGSRAKRIQDLKIVDTMKTTALSEDVDYQRILVYAAKREKATHDYYDSLALGLEGTETGKIFSKLAQEELAHKNQLEREYDEYVLKEN